MTARLLKLLLDDQHGISVEAYEEIKKIAGDNATIALILSHVEILEGRAFLPEDFSEHPLGSNGLSL